MVGEFGVRVRARGGKGFFGVGDNSISKFQLLVLGWFWDLGGDYEEG